MDSTDKYKEHIADTDIFNEIINSIEKELSNMKKAIDSISRLRVEAAYLESDLVMMIDSETWLQISELTGLGTMGLAAGLKTELKEETVKDVQQ